MTKTLSTDVAIAGGGMVGMTLAIALAQAGLSVVVADPLESGEITDPGFDGRNTALAFACCRMFQALGVWPHMAPHAQPINDIVVSDGTVSGGASPLFLTFDHREIGDEPLGHLVENRFIRIALLERLKTVPGVTLVRGRSSTGRTVHGNRAHLTLDDGTVIDANLVVAADGRRSRIRQAAGIRTIEWGYGQTGIVCTVAHEKPHEGIAQEYFLPSGPFAILPMTGNRSSLVWTEKTVLAKGYMDLDGPAFDAEVARRFGPYLGPTHVVGPRWSFPLALLLARRMVGERLALVGDAAHGIHPIAGQGLNLGLKDVAALAEVVSETARVGLDIGAFDAMERYERWRRADTVTLAVTTDLLTRLFSNDIGPLRLARDIGLAAVGRIGPARRLFMRHAGGAVGDLPRLLRGQRLAA